METPEEFLKFIDLIKNKLFYIKDEIVIFDVEDFGKVGHSELEFRSAVNLLKESDLIASERRFQDLEMRTRPPSYKKKLDWLILDDWFIFFMPERLVKERYIIQFHSRDKFFEFYNQICLNSSQTTKPIKERSLSFDKDKSILSISGEQIAIAKKNDKSNAHLVLEYIFDNEEGLSAQNPYSEIADKLFRETTEGTKWMKYYRACNDIQGKITKQTTEKIDNFLIIKTGETGYVQINPNYLPN
ncbi:MAG: hypothetical protein UV68_C0061G0004 [Candidatus Collierbacteria bacterium GW2011_GWC2_43_12]|uniref:Uncharacterized protein n=1 Tax=Candidatus Collierbacteria bacterium GW2011_GWC2_43_12 TaxID=1618390 RepID=A0A0G1D225_9BACT|nr:MAG: hypothetical protein UV68_C0061G0004 [Candidatus Collierbacteria bacterium GW2011_GWC2_43_12]KKU73261.1 MAG: hypothetical protein UX96_C0007G0058 [Candidatus Wolfebacteria bacterium GW2011_GWB1_47_243]